MLAWVSCSEGRTPCQRSTLLGGTIRVVRNVATDLKHGTSTCGWLKSVRKLLDHARTLLDMCGSTFGKHGLQHPKAGRTEISVRLLGAGAVCA